MTVSLTCYLSQELFCGRARSSGLSKFVKLISSRKNEGWKDEGRKDERAKGRSRVSRADIKSSKPSSARWGKETRKEKEKETIRQEGHR